MKARPISIRPKMMMKNAMATTANSTAAAPRRRGCPPPWPFPAQVQYPGDGAKRMVSSLVQAWSLPKSFLPENRLTADQPLLRQQGAGVLRVGRQRGEAVGRNVTGVGMRVGVRN